MSTPSTNLPTSISAVARSKLLRATGWATLVAMVAFVVSPLLSPLIFFGCSALGILWYNLDHGPLAAPKVDLWLVLWLALIVWLFASAFRSPNKVTAVYISALMLALVLATCWTMPRLSSFSNDVRNAIAKAFAMAMLVAACVFLIEALTNGLLRRTFLSFIPVMRGRPSQVTIVGGWVTHIVDYLWNKQTAALTMMFWLGLLIAGRAFKEVPLLPVVRGAAALAAATAIFLSAHEASKLALVLGGITFALAFRFRHLAYSALVTGWIAATLLIVPLAYWANSAKLYHISALQFSGQHRLVIWGTTVTNVFKKPLVGHGLASTRVLDAEDEDSKGFAEGTNIPRGLNTHAHNLFLQVWHEGGAVAALLLCAAGFGVLGWLRQLPAATAPYLFALFATMVTLASLSWSLIAPWYLSAFAIVFLWARFAGDLPPDKTDKPTVPPPAEPAIA